jgi:hypothetical protein
MAGVRVLFTLVTGGGSLSQGSIESDGSGRATVSEWTLSRTVETVVVAATTGLLRIDFHATTEPGPPATLVKFDGDNQTGLAESVVAIRPRVRVSDAYGNGLGGVSVVFAVSAGGGWLTGENVKTDANGIATVGSWTLGSGGAQILTATSASLASIAFQAKVAHPLSSCGVALALPGSTTVQADHDAQGCEGFAIAISKGGTYEFKVSSTVFDAHLELRDEAGNEIAVGGSHANVSGAAIRVVLPPGAYSLVISTFNADVGGQFAVSYAPVADSNGGCEEAFIVRGVDFERSATYANCPGADRQTTSDRFRIRLTGGSRIFAVLEDYSLSINRFDLQNEYGETVATATDRNYVESDLEFTAPADGYYTITVHVEERYRLTVRQ